MKFILPDGDAWQEVTIRDGENGDVIVEMQSKEDVSIILNENKKAQKGPRQTMGKGTQTSQYKLGQISALKTHQLMQQGIFYDDKRLRKWFADLDNELWRTMHKKRMSNAV
jgi:hypothetical protein